MDATHHILLASLADRGALGGQRGPVGRLLDAAGIYVDSSAAQAMAKAARADVGLAAWTLQAATRRHALPVRHLAVLAEAAGDDRTAQGLTDLADAAGEAPLGPRAKGLRQGLMARRRGREAAQDALLDRPATRAARERDDETIERWNREQAARAIYDVGMQRLDAGLPVRRMRLEEERGR